MILLCERHQCVASSVLPLAASLGVVAWLPACAAPAPFVMMAVSAAPADTCSGCFVGNVSLAEQAGRTCVSSPKADNNGSSNHQG